MPLWVSMSSSSSSLGNRSVPWLGEDLSMPSPGLPIILCCLLPDRIAPVLVQVVSPPLGSGWSPLSSFLVRWTPRGDTRGPSVVFKPVDMPCPGPLHCSYSVDYILWRLSSPWPRCWYFYPSMWCWAYIFPFWYVPPQVCSVLVWSVSRSMSAPHVIAGSTQELYTCLFRQGCFCVDIPVFGVCSPACHVYSCISLSWLFSLGQ